MTEATPFSLGGIPLPNTKHLSLGGRHPSQAGIVALDATVENGILAGAAIRPGFMHRAAEKLFEVRDYRAAIMLADRHDWWSSFTGELVVSQSVENAMGLTPPKRAVRLRIILSEYFRIHSHLAYLSYLDGGVWNVADALRSSLGLWSGNRVHPMLNRVGGLAADAPDGWVAKQAKLMAQVVALADRLSEHIPERFRGLAVADQQTCRAYALSGPVARACGLDLDLRRDDPAYDGAFVPVPLREAGDAHARFAVLIDEVRASARMVEHLADDIPDGPIAVRLARRLKVPEGEHISEVEAPWGHASALLVSRGGQTPWRLALRTPTFANVSALEKLLVGVHVDQIGDVVASVGFATGDLDK